MSDGLKNVVLETAQEAAAQTGKEVTEEVARFGSDFWRQLFGGPLSDEQLQKRKAEEERAKLSGINRAHQEVEALTQTTTRPRPQEPIPQEKGEIKTDDRLETTKKAPPPLPPKGPERRAGIGIGG